MRRTSAGFTLVEILLAAALLSTVIGAAMMVFNLSNKSRVVTGAAEGLSAALLFQEQFQSDLRSLVLVGGRAPVRFWPPENGKPSRARLAFSMWDVARSPVTATGPKCGVVPVVYSLEIPAGKTQALPKRAVGASETSVGPTPFTSLAFSPVMGPTGRLIRVTVWAARTVEDSSNPIVHSFLTRVPDRAESVALRADPVLDFANADDRPAAQEFPVR